MVLVLLLTGCMQVKIKPIFPSRLENLEEEFQMGNYVSKVDNFYIILDASSSMSVAYQGDGYGDNSKFKVATDFIKRMNDTLPEMRLNGVIQTFGHGIAKPMRQTETVYGITTYSRLDLEESLNNVSFPAEGNSPAGLAIRATSGIIRNTKGSNAIIFVSDGENLEGSPQTRVKVLNDRYGDRTCFYTVWIGNNPNGKSFMESLAGGMECGLTASIDEIASDKDMINFVKQVFLTADRDSDGDGVSDSIDRCPDTLIGENVDEFGCTKVINIDSDGDGVYDDRDNCPDTLIGEEVDGYGCPKVSNTDSDGDGVLDDRDECPDTPNEAIVDNRGCWVVKGVQFDYKKWDVKPQFNSNLDNVENILKNNLELTIRIEGHTDDIGSMEYNLDLSGKRAQSIKNYLVGKGVDGSRITTVGLGFMQPIAGNDTPEGRALNRRAEIVPDK